MDKKSRNMKKLYTKILGKFTFATIMIALLTDLCFLAYFVKVTERNAQITLDSAVNYSGQALEKLSEEAQLINSLIQKDSDVQAALRDVPRDSNATYSQKLQINGYLFTLQANNTSYIDSFYVLLDDGRQFKSTNFPLLYDSTEEMPEFKTLREYEGEYWLSTYERSMVANNYKTGYVAVCYPLMNIRTGESVGVVVEEILTETLEECLVAAGYLEDVVAEIYDKNGTLLLTVGNGRTADRNIIESSSDVANGWNLRFLCGMWSMVGRTVRMALLLGGLLAAAMIMISVYWSRKIAGSVSKPINRLLDIMKNEELLQRDNEVEIETDIYEVKRLFQKYEQMIGRLKALFGELEQKQQALRKSEFAALQAQINPHFLYNTLDNITWKIRTGDQQDAVEEVVSLSRFFRLSLSKGAEMVPVKNDIKDVQLYLKLQKKRYGDRFDYEVESYIRLADMNRIYVPKLILQPLAENAIYHGFEQTKKGGFIHISVDRTKSGIVFAVRDNGEGIEEKELEKINEKLQYGGNDSASLDGGGYGIYNVNARIKSLFGERYGLILTSEKGCYTCAELTLPPDTEMQEEDTLFS